MKQNEAQTLLNANEVVGKDCAQIALRGEIDSIYARAVHLCAYARQYDYMDLLGNLEDILRVIRKLMYSEATGTPPEVEHIMGLDLDEVRRASHHPESELGVPGYMPDEHTDEMSALLNILRADIRRAERAAVCAGTGHPPNEGIQLVLNRLSSAVYILMLENRAERY